MKYLLLALLLISALFSYSQSKPPADSAKKGSPVQIEKRVVDSTPVSAKTVDKDDSCLQVKDRKIINTCAIEDACLIVRNGQIFNDCAISESCIKFKRSKITSTCGVDTKCITVKGGKFFNSCAITDPCKQIKDGKIVNPCAVKNSCLAIVNLRIVNICSTSDNCLKVVNGKQINTCTEDYACLNDVKSKIRPNCPNCQAYSDETLLVFDAKSRKFFYSRPNEEIVRLYNLNHLRLPYKRPFRVEVVNLNRYLYNVNLGNSDVAFTSTESVVMQQNLIVGANNGQIQPANTYANGSSGNLGDNIFNIVQSFKPNIDKILNLLPSILPIANNDAKLKQAETISKRVDTFVSQNPHVLRNLISFNAIRYTRDSAFNKMEKHSFFN